MWEIQKLAINGVDCWVVCTAEDDRPYILGVYATEAQAQCALARANAES